MANRTLFRSLIGALIPETDATKPRETRQPLRCRRSTPSPSAATGCLEHDVTRPPDPARVPVFPQARSSPPRRPYCRGRDT